ncbi:MULTISPECIES: hypothetical protein [unclassified Cellulophaga]|uniref:hypothetical protein n=1 Tax=unclassified Cellulophaga TaxID=2634405 RepID=UPI0026E3CCF7|nr:MULTISPECIES: hypothetical protein [unclassified Cellulophaga]MDO6489917.1 hypothetical protein [Cellulophaga sp. 2_MG-2023]MDO6494889.1 hypothetical protein [Cellulophaga sp. 3_MG-2023]
MKNVFFALAFMLVGTFAFANENSYVLDKDESLIKIESNYYNNIDIDVQNFIPFKQCKVKIEGTVNGKPVEVSVEFTADDCIEGTVKILKSVIKDIMDK